jgi:nitric oxide reductase subunit B
MNVKKLWIAFIVVTVVSFAVLGYFGTEIYHKAPPIPDRVVDAQGAVLFTAEDIREGQNVWQSIGGQEVGSVWGHGAYVAPDWSADRLHREAALLLDLWAVSEEGVAYDRLPPEAQTLLRARLKEEIRTNTYDPSTKSITVSTDRTAAITAVSTHYASLFGADTDPEIVALRKAYAIPAESIKTPERLHQINAFFFWTAWSCGTNRPGSSITYTNNWPAEPLIDNTPTASIMLWSVVSMVVLLAGIGGLVWIYARQRGLEEAPEVPDENPLARLVLTPSMRATLKYFWVVALLFIAQIGAGALTAHYGVEGNGLFGLPLDRWLPYSVARTWHNQLGIFWIATAWLATGLFVAPAVGGREPRFQKLGVNVLFGALLVIVVGSLAGEWMGVQQKFGNVANFWFGHQGYEYVDLGRFWQIFLFAGLFIWLGLMARALWPALRRPSESRSLLAMFTISCVAIAAFYGAGLMWGRHTHLSMAEYWRWWVVHLWVEGFFEVFATAVIAFLFTRLGLVRVATATAAVIFSTIIYLFGGILGTFHHLYFAGTPTAVIAIGATFSALEIVPLVLVGFEGYENLRLSKAKPWVQAYRWPILFFVAVAFWNLVGAGLFGFLINPPIALYYMQGLNLTPVHGHTALFGVYGMLGIGLMLFCLRVMGMREAWNDRLLATGFWGMNAGLVLMVVLSMLPVGLIQTWASMHQGLWYARSAEFLQQPYIQNLRWMRVFGDTVFTVGAVAVAAFVLGLKLRFGPAHERVTSAAPAAQGARRR